MYFVFLPQYFLILFNATFAIFENPSYISTSLIFCHNSFISFFFVIINRCFNTTFSPCFFCNFYNHFIHTHTKNIKFSNECFFFWPNKIISCVSYQSHAYIFSFLFFIYFFYSYFYYLFLFFYFYLFIYLFLFFIFLLFFLFCFILFFNFFFIFLFF